MCIRLLWVPYNSAYDMESPHQNKNNLYRLEVQSHYSYKQLNPLNIEGHLPFPKTFPYCRNSNLWLVNVGSYDESKIKFANKKSRE